MTAQGPFVLAMLERLLPNIRRAQCDQVFREAVSALFCFVTEGRPHALAHAVSDFVCAVSEACGRGDTSVLAAAPCCSFVVKGYLDVCLEWENVGRVMGDCPHLFSDTSWLRNIASSFGGCADAAASAAAGAGGSGDLRLSAVFRKSLMIRLLKRLVAAEESAAIQGSGVDHGMLFAHTIAAMVGAKSGDAIEQVTKVILDEDIVAWEELLMGAAHKQMRSAKK